jgi:hypothetical protein
MVSVFDFLDDPETGDLRIEGGDFVTGESTLQHQRDLLITERGQYRLHPDVGVGLASFINDDLDRDDITSAIQAEFTKDGMAVGRIKINSVDSIEIAAQYK